MRIEYFQHSHKRYNPLTREWVMVSPQRLARPWQGKVEKTEEKTRPSYDAGCYLCPGNQRAGEKRNPLYNGTFVFENDFPALIPNPPMDEKNGEEDGSSLLVSRPERGICRVICFNPRHDVTLAEMGQEEILSVVNHWVEQYQELGNKEFIRYIQIFENKGEMMGCSNPHPHGQIWATETIPLYPGKEEESQKRYYEEKGKACLLCQYLKEEQDQKERVVLENESWLVVVPFWAVWPYETLLLSKEHIADMWQMDGNQKKGLANILKGITIRYDNLFQISFPYSMGFHQSPTDGGSYPHWHLHGHYYPPLLRSATIQKFMVGFEMLGTPQRDITTEQAAERLRSVSPVHYRKKEAVS